LKNADVGFAVPKLAEVQDVEGQEIAHHCALGKVETAEQGQAKVTAGKHVFFPPFLGAIKPNVDGRQL